ncbi:hypothetical protein BHYA_0313g00110 [Botrytis hyacinthi]|uniref:Major facilitator superfamily (MFS) profile domain-containing protein n=1 Tax=Botrytis hyacinthi TaxID=278943 RepID=A0A4Z1GBM3_9HELO|nr:hypothetical protein BHYA_0313g00110 [Botrytis hyacinthi]
MNTATRKSIVFSDNRNVLVLAGQKQDVKSVQPVLDPNDEASRRLETLRNEYGSTWNGLDDLENSYNWLPWLKIAIGVIFSLGQLVTLISASMIAAALGDISRDFKLAGPVMADMYGKRKRGKSLAIASFLTYLGGPALGPILGDIIAQLVVWPWIFWIMPIFNIFLTLAGYFFILPIFGTQLYEKLGFGLGNSLLGFIWIVSGGPICFVLYYWGERIREIDKETEDRSSPSN